MSINWNTKATRLLAKLKANTVKDPQIFGENYGQKEVSAFEDKMRAANVPYAEQARIAALLQQIADFSPVQGSKSTIKS